MISPRGTGTGVCGTLAGPVSGLVRPEYKVHFGDGEYKYEEIAKRSNILGFVH